MTTCLRCAAPAQDRHHHREELGPVGKGMGGTHEHLPEVPLCRPCHDAIHRNEWAFCIQGDFYVGTKGGDFRSPIRRDDLADVALRSESALRDMWHRADETAAMLLKAQCEIAWVLKERCGWKENWAEHAANLLSLDDEKAVHWQRVYERCKMYELVELILPGKRWEAAQMVGVKALRQIAKADDPEEAFDAAIDQRLAGVSGNRVAQQLSNQSEVEMCVCPSCGHEHRRRDGRDDR